MSFLLLPLYVDIIEAVFKSSTDLGAFNPLTVSAQDRLELDELIEDVDPKGNEADPDPDLLLAPKQENINEKFVKSI